MNIFRTETARIILGAVGFSHTTNLFGALKEKPTAHRVAQRINKLRKETKNPT